MDENRVASAPASVWLSPQDAPPPRGVKLLLRTVGDVAVIGTWSEEGGFTHWAALPRLSGPRPVAEGRFDWALGTNSHSFRVDAIDDQRCLLTLRNGSIRVERTYSTVEVAVMWGCRFIEAGLLPPEAGS